VALDAKRRPEVVGERRETVGLAVEFAREALVLCQRAHQHHVEVLPVLVV